MTAGEYLKRELSKVACGTYEGESDLESLVDLWKKPWGVELCKRLIFPTANFFSRYENELMPYGVFLNQSGLRFYNRDIVLIGSAANLEFSLPEKTYTVMLYHGSKAVITAKNCAVVKVHKITSDNEVFVMTYNHAKVVVN